MAARLAACPGSRLPSLQQHACVSWHAMKVDATQSMIVGGRCGAHLTLSRRTARLELCLGSHHVILRDLSSPAGQLLIASLHIQGTLQ